MCGFARFRLLSRGLGISRAMKEKQDLLASLRSRSFSARRGVGSVVGLPTSPVFP
jgi:hypothetical protein